jgi:NADH dehydrogenase/NADH:ubiquinone oxidoreductase subunit G
MSDQSADLLDPYEKLISLEINGKQVSVPEKNRLLRCFQYLSINTISYGDFCWNGDCTNCLKGQDEQNDRPALSCRLECEEGMVITRLSRFIELEGITK